MMMTVIRTTAGKLESPTSLPRGISLVNLYPTAFLSPYFLITSFLIVLFPFELVWGILFLSIVFVFVSHVL